MATKFHLKHHWVGGKAALDFGLDRIKSLVSMATDISHRIIMKKMLLTLFCLHFDQIFLILVGNKHIDNISHEFEFRQDRTKDCGVSCS